MRFQLLPRLRDEVDFEGVVVTDHEMWKPIPGFPDYDASTLGRVRSWRRARIITAETDVRASGATARLMTETVGPCGYRTLGLYVTNRRRVCRRVCELVLLTFVGEPPVSGVGRHLDGDPTNCALSNLAWGTEAQRAADYAARAEREEAAGAPTHCEVGHRFAPTYLGDFGRRYCRECAAAKLRALRLAKASEHYKKSPTTGCIDCGVQMAQDITSPGQTVLRCPSCRKVAQRDAVRRYKQRLREGHQPSRCVDCGVLIPVTSPGKQPTRCVPHQMLADRETGRRSRENRR